MDPQHHGTWPGPVFMSWHTCTSIFRSALLIIYTLWPWQASYLSHKLAYLLGEWSSMQWFQQLNSFSSTKGANKAHFRLSEVAGSSQDCRASPEGPPTSDLDISLAIFLTQEMLGNVVFSWARFSFNKCKQLLLLSLPQVQFLNASRQLQRAPLALQLHPLCTPFCTPFQNRWCPIHILETWCMTLGDWDAKTC